MKCLTDDEVSAVRDLSERLDFEIAIADDTSMMEMAMETLIKHCSDASMRQSLYESAEMDEEELARFYQSMARFYRAALWQSIPGEHVLQMIYEEDDRMNEIFAVIMGQMGQHRGLIVVRIVKRWRT